MRDTRIIMEMPITVEIVSDDSKARSTLEAVFEHFHDIDERFSTYKETSEISMINRGEIDQSQWSAEMHEVFELSQKTKLESDGYFDIKRPDSSIDPSGIVKGLAIHQAGAIILNSGFEDFFVDAGGDVESKGKNTGGHEWSVGIKNPFRQEEIVKVVFPKGHGIATSGSYIRGAHIYDPHDPRRSLEEIVSVTVIGRDVLEADRFATAAFAMQRNGINLIERMPDLEGYMIDKNGTATMTSGFERFTNV